MTRTVACGATVFPEAGKWVVDGGRGIEQHEEPRPGGDDAYA